MRSSGHIQKSQWLSEKVVIPHISVLSIVVSGQKGKWKQGFGAFFYSDIAIKGQADSCNVIPLHSESVVSHSPQKSEKSPTFDR